MPYIGLEKFNELVGESVTSKKIANHLFDCDMRYEIFTQEEKEDHIIRILEDIKSNHFSPPGKDKWKSGWEQNLEEYKNSNDLKDLVPKYRGIDTICRMDGEFVKPQSETFETDLYTAFHQWTAVTYFEYCDHIFEFGCGTGINLKTFADRYPQKYLHGLDWVQPSVDSVNLLGTNESIRARGHLFNMFEPDYTLDVPEKSAFYTFHALEQLGENYNPFLDFILAKKPKIIVHFEPIVEFYNIMDAFDYTAVKFHNLRKYLKGYYKALEDLQKTGKIRILKSYRNRFGSYYQESSAIVVWEII